MDDTTRRIADYAATLTYDDLSEAAVHAATRSLVDTLACAVASYDCMAASIGRRLARGAVPERYPGRILGYAERATAEAAAFVNTAMIRDLDWNDQYPGGHPSDCLGAFLALAETAAADGRRLLSAMVVAYELFIRLNDATSLRTRGWDQGFGVAVCTAAGVGHLLRLSAEQIAEAVAIAAVSSVPMRNTRAGALGLWKGVATSFACRDGTFAALLAAEGMTGADRPFEGKHGLMDLITGPFELEALPGGEGGRDRIAEMRLKYWPVESNAQLVIAAALELREQVDWRDLERVDVGTYSFAYSEIGSEPEKWDPRTRETADHSLPYIFARALVDGRINQASFAEEKCRDPALRPLMNKIHVHVDDALDALYPETIALTLEVTTADGRRIDAQPRNPLGHNTNPMQDDDVRAKFLGAAEPVLGADRAKAALERWWDARDTADLPAALALLDLP